MSAQLTVATFNIRNGRAPDGRNQWVLRRHVTAAWMRRLDADVVGLQEAYAGQRTYLSRRLPDHAVVGVGRDRDGGGEQVPIFVRHPLQLVGVRHHWFSDTPDLPGSKLPGAKFPRLATIATLRHRDSGLHFVVANLHLDATNEANRVTSARQLVRVLSADLPTIVLGDFNTIPGRSKVFTALDEAGFARLPYEGSSFNGFKPVLTNHEGPIDQILVRDGGGSTWHDASAHVVSAPVGPMPSDHWPVAARLRLDG